MLDQICANDDLIIGFGIIFVAVLAVWSETVFGRQLSQAEKYLDVVQWSGDPQNAGVKGHLKRGLRATTGLGYTPAGRALWWQGYRYSLVSAALIVVLILAFKTSAMVCS